MATTLLGTGRNPSTSTANTTEYWNAIGDQVKGTTETNQQILIRSAGTLTKLYVRVTANTIAGTTTFRTRINATTNGNLSVSIGSSATGAFEDTTNSDTIAAGDKICFQSVPGAATNTMSIGLYTVFYGVSGTTISRVGTSGLENYATASTTAYQGLWGRQSAANTTEANVKTRIREAGTFKNLAVGVRTNARTTDTTFRSRKNGANGNLLVTIGAGVTGWVEDTTNSDTVAVDDDYNTSITTGTGTETLANDAIVFDFENTNNRGLIGTGHSAGVIQGEPQTRFYPVRGRLETTTTTESDNQQKCRDITALRELSAFISANTVNATTPITSRKNGANGAMSLSVGSSATGLFIDTTNVDSSLVSTDLIDYQVDTPAVGGTQTITLRWIQSVTDTPGASITMTNDNTKTYSNKFITRV